METIVGMFVVHEAALRAGERAREVTRPGTSIRVTLPQDGGAIVEADVLEDRGTFPGLAVASAALGLVGAGVLVARGHYWSYAGVWFGWSVAFGLMMAIWLTGQHLRARRRTRTRPEQENAPHRAVVTAVVNADEVEKVARVFERDGGYVVKDSHGAGTAAREDGTAGP